MDVLKKCDFLRLTWTDIHGIPRCRSVSKKHFKRFLDNGIGAHFCSVCYGIRSELPNISVEGKGQFSNMVVCPILSTAHMLPWAGDGAYQIGQVLCDTKWDSENHIEASSRHIAVKQLEKLEELGYQLYSGYEAEFYVLNGETKEADFKVSDYMTTLVLARSESLLCEIQEQLGLAGVDIDTLTTEYSPGQMEVTTAPTNGIQAADWMFIAKQGIKEICQAKGLLASFMTKPFKDHFANGLHYNFSLLDTSGKPVMFNESKPHKMANIAKWWLGGLIKHARGLTILNAPTVNDYRRLHTVIAPHAATWGVDDRVALFRILNQGPSGTYIENRMPGGSANPYLVMAGIVAAGIDGIQNKIEPPEARPIQGLSEDSGGAEILPANLAEALKALKEDDCLMGAFGQQFYAWFKESKTNFEIKKMSSDDKDGIKKEFDYYIDIL